MVDARPVNGMRAEPFDKLMTVSKRDLVPFDQLRAHEAVSR